MIRPFAGRSTQGPPDRWWKRLTFRDAVVFTVPPLLLLAYLLVGSIADYQESLQFDDSWSRGRHLDDFFVARAARAARLPRAASLTLQLDPDADDPGIVRLRVARDQWTEVEQNPLVGWGRWLDATLIVPGGSIPVELRKRGDTSLHWTTGKLSFTLQTPKSEHFHGYREAALSQKSVLIQHLTNSLPRRFGLLTPFTTVTPVFLNDRYYGIFRFVEEVDESFVRRNGRMPGNVFRADAAERSEYYKGLPRAVFRNPDIWDRVAEEDVRGVAPDSALRELIRAVNGTSLDDHLHLMSLVERNEIARLLGTMLVVGDPYHMSGVHNQFWYEDPSTGHLHPIPWDLRLLPLGGRPAPLNEFLRAALRDPYLPDLTLTAVKRQIAAGLLAWAERTTNNVFRRYRPHIEYDRLRSDVIDDPGTPEQILSGLKANLDTLDAWMSNARTLFHSTRTRDGTAVLDFATVGYAGADLTGLEVSGATFPEGLRLVADRNRNGVRDASDPVVGGPWLWSSDRERIVAGEAVALLQGWDTSGNGIQPGSMHYRFFLEGGVDTSGEGFAVRPVLENRITGEPASVSPWEEGTVIPRDAAFNPWEFPAQDVSDEIRLEGTVSLTEDLVVPGETALIVEPGTRIVLAPDVSILAYGRVIAEGTRDRPIRFVSSDPRRPWGALALQGSGSDGSRFRNVEFRGGGGSTLGRVAYTGMVSVYRARDVSFDSVLFADNLRSDDALRALHAEVELSHCEFRRTNSDGIDFDHSDGAITDCTFRDARNDAVDLMTSSPTIIGNSMSGSGDKGISIGEESHPLVVNNRISSGSRGIEVKDGSEPFIVHNTIRDNDIGILQQVKNWRYGTGGHAKVALNRIEDNERQVEHDARSRVTGFGNRVVPSIVDSVSDSIGPSTPALGRSGALPDDTITKWIHRRLGWTDAPGTPGALPSWNDSRPHVARDSVIFREGFDRGLRDWSHAGGVEGLHRSQRRLVIRVRERAGLARRSLDWEVHDSNRSALAVVEVASRGLDSIAVVFRGPNGSVARTARPGPTIRSFEWLALALPPGRYDSLDLRLFPRAGSRRIDAETGLVEVGTGRLELRGLWLYGEDSAQARVSSRSTTFTREES